MSSSVSMMYRTKSLPRGITATDAKVATPPAMKLSAPKLLTSKATVSWSCSDTAVLVTVNTAASPSMTVLLRAAMLTCGFWSVSLMVPLAVARRMELRFSSTKVRVSSLVSWSLLVPIATAAVDMPAAMITCLLPMMKVS